MGSNAVPNEFISRVVGYKITKGDFSNVTPNLPQRIAIIGEANSANQPGLTDEPVEVTSAQQAGALFGYGSPIHMAMRILRPVVGDGIGGIPTIVYPQVQNIAVAKEIEITITGNADANVVHTIVIGGRRSLDGDSYDYAVLEDDTPTIVAGKLADSVNAVLGSPFIAIAALGVVTLTSKWQGKSADKLNATVDINGNGAALTYVELETATASGTPTAEITDSLELFQNNWNTIVVNLYSMETAVLDILETYNGRPDPVAPTGRYSGVVMKPFIALSGSVKEDNQTETDARLDDVTIAVCPAPLSPGHPLEAAANMALLFGRTAQDTPHMDVMGRSYADMPVPTDEIIGDMSEYINRDVLVKKGNSTVDLLAGRYRIQDFVTTYHPIGESVPQFRYCRNLMLDFNVRFGYFILEEINVVDKTIAADNDPVAVTGVVKPKTWKAILYTYAEDLVARALIVDASFMQDSITVNLGTSNPDRLETFFRYKRTSMARVSSTTAEAGFNFGELNN